MAKPTARDMHILRLVQGDASLTNAAIGQTVGLSPSNVSRSIERMEQAGIITGRQVLIDPEKVALPASMLLMVAVDNHKARVTDPFEALLDSLPYVVEWSALQGSWDYLLKIVARDAKHLDDLHHELREHETLNRTRVIQRHGVTHKKPLPL